MRLSRSVRPWRARVLVRALGAVALPLVAGCTVGPDFKASQPFAPASWLDWHKAKPAPSQEPSQVATQPVDPQWWTAFGDPVLVALEDRVSDENLDVRTASVRLAESRAQRNVAGADQFPTFNGNASYTREKASNKGVFSAFGTSQGNAASSGAGQGTSANGTGLGTGGIAASSSGFPPFDIYQYGFDASWELDLWGRVRREVEGADAAVAASAEARRAALISAQAELARDYMQLRGAQETLRITNENLSTAQQSLQLTRERAAGGLTTDLDVANAAAQVATTASQIPQLQQQQALAINAISLLLGEAPDALESVLVTPKPIPMVPPVVPIGLPSDLARRRPDIRQAEAQLHEATADIGVAIADFYPRVSLSGSVGIQATQFKNLDTLLSQQYAAGPSLTIPIFQGGQLRGTLELRNAQQQEAAVAYHRTVLAAWHDVDNALVAYDAEQRRRDQLARAVSASQQALGLARQRYQQGVADFLDVLTAERTLLAAQQQFADSTTTISTNLVALFKALGGGWEKAYPDETQVAAAP
jgi:NodT family efflux transporter outer membrane factor (OMF) lipoprotein